MPTTLDDPSGSLPLPSDFARSAAYPVLHIDFVTGASKVFEFVPADYLRAAFLDERALAHRHMRGWSVPLDKIAAALALHPAPSRPVHWLFHVGHCGSTLISRLLDAVPGLLGLREPLPILELAMLSVERDSAIGRIDHQTFHRDLDITLALLGRGFPDTRAVLVKPTSVAALIGPEILERQAQSRAVMLSMNLRHWLATMLRSPTLRIGLRQQAPVRIAAWHRLTGERDLRIPALDDAQLAALSWLVQQLQWDVMRAQPGLAQRLLRVDFDQFLRDPGHGLLDICTHLGITADPLALAPERSTELLGRYAKDPTQRFDVDTRRREIDQALGRFAGEVARGMDWARAALTRLNGTSLVFALD